MRSKSEHKRSYAGFVGAEGGAPVAPANTVAPSITGAAQVGETLTAADGTWIGREAPSFRYQWNADDAAITGATAKTYVPVEDDVGKTITVTVIGANWKGALSVTSDATAAVIAAEE